MRMFTKEGESSPDAALAEMIAANWNVERIPDGEEVSHVCYTGGGGECREKPFAIIDCGEGPVAVCGVHLQEMLALEKILNGNPELQSELDNQIRKHE